MTNDLSKLSDESLRDVHKLTLASGLAYRAAGNSEKAYEQAQKLRRISAEMQVRMLMRSAA